MARTNAILEAALRLRSAGLALLPLKGKAPHTKLLPRGSDGKPSTDALRANPASESDLLAWFAGAPGANIGVFTGAAGCSVLGVDLDPGKCPDRARATLLREQGGPTREVSPGVVLPPSSLHVLSGSQTGGRHLYYAHPPEQVRCVTRQGHRAGSHIDLQAEGRYLVLPPSIHPDTGAPYLWVDGEDRVLSLDRVIELLAELPPAPTWAIRSDADDRRAPETPRIQSGAWLTDAWARPCPEGGTRDGTGGRKQTLRSLVQYLAQREYPLDAALAMIAHWNKTLARPPLRDQEVTNLTHWMYEKVHEERCAHVADRVSLRTRGPAWPHDLFLGTRFGRWVAAISGARSTVHPDAVATCGLGALGAASTGGYRLHYLEDGIELTDHHWVAPSALWVMPVLESGQGKSIAYREVAPILEETNASLAEVARRWNVEREALEEELQAAKKAAAAACVGEHRRLAIEARREISQRIADLPAVMGERWILSEGTPEAFLCALGATDHLALLSEEGDETISKFFGHYSGAADMNGVLKSWDGGKTTQARIGRGVTVVEGLASMLVMVQPDVLRSLGGAQAEGRGLMARFLFSVPNPRHRRTPEDGDVPTKAQVAHAREDFASAIHAIYYGGTAAAATAAERALAFRPEYEPDPTATRLDIPTDDGPPRRGRPAPEFVAPSTDRLIRPLLRQPVDVIFQGECVDALKTLEADLKAQSVEGGEHFTARTFARKAHEHAMRIAAVLQLCEHPPKDHETVVMDLHWVNRAIALVKNYFIPHYYVAKELIDSPPHADLGLHILTHFADRDSFTLGEAAALVNKRTPDIRPVLLWLDQVGAVRVETRGKSLVAYPLPGVEY